MSSLSQGSDRVRKSAAEAADGIVRARIDIPTN